ncbi:MAG: amino acid ABC transporter permease [Thermotogae bacterium]|jgi:polar amino acid transport system permease protein|nr:amino acid ABC transporter permease [Thermotogota bacterium]MCL5031714.1 amino acid ABC transporter permease [Thermotogota bacterium]
MIRFINVFVNAFPFLMDGLVFTVELALSSIAIGFLIGIVVGISRSYGKKWSYMVSTAFVEVIRGTPLLVQLFIFYFALPQIGIRLSPIIASIISFSINSGAYQAEYIRGAIQSVDTGQMKAALSIGMTKWQAITRVVMPQALIKVIPSWTNEFVYLIKYTSVAYLVGVPELMAQGEFIASRNFEFMDVFLSVAIIYLVIVLLITWGFSKIEKAVRMPGV